MTNSNVTPIESKQPQPQAKFSITCTLDDFPIVIEGEGRAGDLKIIIDRLKAIGAEPPQIAHASTSAPIAPVQAEPTKKAPPVCPDHHTPMKASRKPGRYFCPRQNDDGSYCAHQA